MIYLVFCLVFVPYIVFAQSSIGVNIGLQNSLYFSTYSKVLDIPSCCEEYSNPVSNSISLGLFHTLLLNQKFGLLTSVQYSSLTASTTSKASYPVLINNSVQNAEFLYTSVFRFNNLELTSGIQYSINDNFSFGSRIGVVMEFATNYTQKEEIVTTGVDYKNSNFESVSNKSIENSLFKPTIVLFTQYSKPISKNISFISRLDVSTIFGDNSIPINKTSLHTRLLLGIEIPIDKFTNTSPLEPKE
jgi:hypothetical protein